MTSLNRYRIAYFISPHGFGHATRAAAIMDALFDIDPTIEFDIFTTVPEWLFENSLRKPFTYHRTLTDVGLVQKTPFEEDLENTLIRLADLYPYDERRIDETAKMLSQRKCNLILCDISPMGIAVGEAAGIPSLLIENFTWDWIYEAYTSTHPKFAHYIEYLQELFPKATHHVQTDPLCSRKQTHILLPPISRKPRMSRKDTRNHLSIPHDAKVAMITMGGIPGKYAIRDKLKALGSITFILSGGDEPYKRMNNVITLPHRSEFFHPDLIHASDIVIGKAGYSTLAEVYDAGRPFIYVKRPTFKESDSVTSFVQGNMTGIGISEAQFEEGDWVPHMFDLLQAQRINQKAKTGAEQAAAYIYDLFV